MSATNTTLDQIFDQLWKDYTEITPNAAIIKQLFEDQGEVVLNDHVAFRTLDLPHLNVDQFAQIFVDLGYEEKGDYHFEAKKLYAKHYEFPGNKYPKVFISQLKFAECSEFLQKYIKEIFDGIKINPHNLYKTKRVWEIDYPLYLELKHESEYAAWLAAFGFMANHFTVSVNQLKNFSSIQAVNEFLKESGHKLNSQGGEIKGSPEVFLEQSSTLAYNQKVRFKHGPETIPSCYYEFALRYPLENGELFQGFVAGSADKIFESTDKGQ
jgi:hypothetical protein